MAFSPQTSKEPVDLARWVSDKDWWVVKGSTGSGKTFFVEHLKDLINADGKPVVYVPQFPMFKPQLGTMTFLNMLPLTKEAREKLYSNLAAMEVPTNGKVGGKVMGMIELPGLSGGQRKKMLLAICIAVATSWQCPFIVLDEPFAGIDADSMDAVLKAMTQGQTTVPGMKYIIVTHDHFDLLPSTAVLLQVKDRVVRSSNGYDKHNGEAAVQFATGLTAGMTAAPKPRPLVDLYLIKRHFLEVEFGMPLMAHIIFSLLLGVATVNYEGGLPGMGMDTVYVFMKLFLLEYPHFGSIINYCFKRSQHMEDYFLNITKRDYGILETMIIALIQEICLVALATAIMSGVSGLWWINVEVFLVDLWYSFVTCTAYFLLPIIVPNPIMAMGSIFPYVCVWGFLNGVLLPRVYYWEPVKWLAFLSPIYNVACSYRQVTDKIQVADAECSDSLFLHMLFINPFGWAVALGIAVKWMRSSRKSRNLRKKSSVPPST